MKKNVIREHPYIKAMIINFLAGLFLMQCHE